MQAERADHRIAPSTRVIGGKFEETGNRTLEKKYISEYEERQGRVNLDVQHDETRREIS